MCFSSRVFSRAWVLFVLVLYAACGYGEVNFQPIQWAETHSGSTSGSYRLKWERVDEQPFDSRTFFELEEIRDDADSSSPGYEFQHTYYVTPREIHTPGDENFPDQYHKVLKFHRKLRNRFDYQYRVRPCQRNDAFEVICGAWTSQITKDVSPSLFEGPDPEDMPWLDDDPGRGTQTDALIGGAYRSVRGGRSGMTLHWANNLRRDENDPLFEDVYDLVIVWMTHHWDENLQRFVPIWLYSQMTYKEGTQDQLQGPIYYLSYEGFSEEYEWVVAGYIDIDLVGDNYTDCDEDTGTVPADKNMIVDVDWRTGLPGMYVDANTQGSIIRDRLVHMAHPNAAAVEPRAGMVCDSMLIAHSTDSDGNPIDHFQGWYKQEGAVNEGYGIISAIFNEMELIHFLFTNDHHNPIWATAQWEDIGAGDPDHNIPPSQPAPIGTSSDPVEFCAFTVFDAPPPTAHAYYRGTHVSLGCDWPDGQDVPNGYNVKRYFEPLDEATVGTKDRHLQITTDINLDSGPDTVGASLNIGSYPNFLDRHIKITHFHDIRPVIDGSDQNTQCFHAPGESCQMALRWFRDGYYPGAGVYRVQYDGSGFDETDVVERILVPGSTAEGPSVPDFPLSIDADGLYRFELRKSDDPGSDLLAESAEIEVLEGGPEEAPTPAGDPGFAVDAASQQVGATRGEFRVDESGAATYSLEVMTLLGAGGVAPRIGVRYSSSGGGGRLGPGWSLTGLSTISRCGQTLEAGDGGMTGVNLNAGDRFCLDGQRLKLETGSYGAPGSEYRLEVDNHTRVIAYGQVGDGPAYFEVYRKDGSVSTYGVPAADGSGSRVMAPSAGVVLAWPVSRFEDSAGNYYTFGYTHPHGGDPVEWLPERIDYTGNTQAGTAPYAHIEFSHRRLPRAQRTSGYLAGARQMKTRVIDGITSHGEGGQVLRDYRFDYVDTGSAQNQYVIESITECWSLAGGDCFAPVELEWEHAATYLPHPALPPVDPHEIDDFSSARRADLNGDGRQDVVFLHKDAGQSSSSAAFGALISQPDGSLVRAVSRLNACGGEPEDIQSWQVMDADGDAFQGLVYLAECLPGQNQAEIWHHPWDMATQRFGPGQSLMTFSTTELVEPVLSVMDWTGDGLSDLVLTSKATTLSASDRIWFLENVSTGAAGIAFDGPFYVDTTFSWEPGGNDLPGCSTANPLPQRQAQLKLLTDFPVSADHSGKVSFAIHAYIRYVCYEQPASQLFSNPNDITEAELDQLETSGDLEVVWEGNARGVYSIEEDSGDLVWNEFGGLQVSANAVIAGADLNGDGYTDFISFNGDSGGCQDHACFHINTGSGFEKHETTIPVDENVAPLAFAMDYDGDGYPDLMVPSDHDSSTASWEVYPWRWSSGTGYFQSTPLPNGPQLGTLINGDQSVFLDLNGNGRTDLINFRKRNIGDEHQVRRAWAQTTPTLPAYAPRGKITRFTDGLGAWTEVEYQSLAQRSVYTRDNNGPYDGYGNGSVVYDVTPPLYVVAAAESLAPQHVLNASGTGSTPYPQAATRVEYYYTGAKLQGGGRGFLGFREVASYDVQDQMLTRTRYRQDFPFLGRPESTDTWYQPGEPWSDSDDLPPVTPCTAATPCDNTAIQAGIVLGRSADDWQQTDTDADLPYPYRHTSQSWHYSPTYTDGVLTGSDLTHRVVTTQSALDDYGNIGQIQQDTYDGTSQWVAGRTTVNTYDNNPGAWYLGRLTCATVTRERLPPSPTKPVNPSATRISTFGYDPATGILNRETVQANDCDDADGRLRTDYGLDDFGNRKQKTVTETIDASSSVVRRHSAMEYDDNGRYVDREYVYIGGSSKLVKEVESRNKYGEPTAVTNAQGVTSNTYYDDSGRPHYTYSPDGAWSRTRYAWGGGGTCPSGTAFHEIMTSADGAEQRICKDILGRETRTASRGFGGDWVYTDTHYDYASRVLETSEPYYAGQANYWTRTVYDEAGRPEFVLQASGVEVQYSYAGLDTTTTLTSQAPDGQTTIQTRTVEKNALGEKTRVTAADGGVTTYGYDALGQVTEVDGPMPGTDDRVEIGYDEMGHKAWQDDPDKGIWEYRHNALGELICQIDAKGQGTYIVYDDLGRKTARAERSGVNDVDDCSKGTLAGVTTWTYGNLPQTPEFGQVIGSTHEYFADGASVYGWTQKQFDYDSLGRVEDVTTTIRDGQGAQAFEREYTEATTYDQFGRVFQEFDASGDGRGVRYHYNAHGYRHKIQEAQYGSAGPVYWEVTEMDARGQISTAVMGNGTIVTAEHDPVTGRLENLTHDTGSNHAVDLELDWDAIGRLFTRRDRAGHDPQGQVYDQTEQFFYDPRNRIKEVKHRTGSGSFTPVQRLNYDVAGNILCKSDVSTTIDCSSPQDENYTYGGPKPHAVTEVHPGAVYGGGNTAFTYDVNGNMVTETVSLAVWREFSYTVSDRVRHVSTDSARTEFHYGPDRQRTLRRDLENSTIQARTHYVGSVEVVLDGSHPAPNSGEYRRYIGGIAIATYFAETGVNQTRYLHKDHLGSITAISDETGQVVTWMSFDAWGQRRDSASWHPWNEPPAQYLSAMLAITPRGFTGHEHIEHANIVHMNGRIYDPHLGRFLQADPLVEDSTTLNRYTYVHNNPLAYTDPSGFLSLGDVVKIAAAVVISIYTAGAASTLYAAGNTAQAIAVVAAGGATAGALASGTAEGALWGAFSATVFFGIGQWLKSTDWAYIEGTKELTGTGYAAKVVSHGLAGGVIRDLQGGKFGHGFLSSGVTAAASPKISTLSDNDYVNGAVAATLGGTVSSLTGGKFKNGALTAAFQYAFNQVASSDSASQNSKISGGYTLKGGDYSSDSDFVLIRDPRTKEAFYVPKAIAPEVLEAIASNRGDMYGRSNSRGVSVNANGFLGVFGGSGSIGYIEDSAGNQCIYFSACGQVGLGMGAGVGFGGELSVSEQDDGTSYGHGPFGFGGAGAKYSGSLDVANHGAAAGFFGAGGGAAGGYQWCVQGKLGCF